MSNLKQHIADFSRAIMMHPEDGRLCVYNDKSTAVFPPTPEGYIQALVFAGLTIGDKT